MLAHGRTIGTGFNLPAFLATPEGIPTISDAINLVFKGKIPESAIREMRLAPKNPNTKSSDVATIVSGDTVILVYFQQNIADGIVNVTAKVA